MILNDVKSRRRGLGALPSFMIPLVQAGLISEPEVSTAAPPSTPFMPEALTNTIVRATRGSASASELEIYRLFQSAGLNVVSDNDLRLAFQKLGLTFGVSSMDQIRAAIARYVERENGAGSMFSAIPPWAWAVGAGAIGLGAFVLIKGRRGRRASAAPALSGYRRRRRSWR
jgi:hypothetical protein